MPNRARLILVTLACVCGGVAMGEDTRGPAPRYVATRDVVIDFELTAGALSDGVELWVSRDGGWCWDRVCADRLSDASVGFVAPHDGRFELILVPFSPAGPTVPPPEPGDVPHAVVVVDTLPPLLQLHGVPTVLGDPGALRYRQRVSAIDENLGARPLRVFRRDGDGVWQDAGRVSVDRDAGVFEWCAPAATCGSALRVMASDLAGNRVVVDWVSAAAVGGD